MKVYSHKKLRGFTDTMYHHHVWDDERHYKWRECWHYEIADVDKAKGLALGAKPLPGNEFSCKG